MTDFAAESIDIIDHVEIPTVINQVSYTIQCRTLRRSEGPPRQEYRVLLDGLEIRPWIEGEILPFFLQETATEKAFPFT